MSDFIYSSKNISPSNLTSALSHIYAVWNIPCYTFNGVWGAIAATNNHYHGFNPYETDRHILIVAGGPLLRFTSEDKYSADNAATKLIYERWIHQGNIKWDDDLSGSFAIILIDKHTKSITIVTDILSSIPVYFHESHPSSGIIDTIGTHADSVASASGATDNLDPTSLADLLFNRTIVFPYTPYYNIFQFPPAQQIIVDRNKSVSVEKVTYWEPAESSPFSSVNEAAEEVRYKLEEEVKLISNGTDHVAVLLSGGEDSRTILGILSDETDVTGITIAGSENLETYLASLTAQAYHTNIEVLQRPIEQFIDFLEHRSLIVGMQHEFIHTHTYGVIEKNGINHYDAVIGGYLADTYLKGDILPAHYKIAGIKLSINNNALEPGNCIQLHKLADYTNQFILANLTQRYEEQKQRLSEIRPHTYREWMWIYPMTMRKSAGHFFSNRRLFCTYEPFMGSDIIKLSAVIPQRWKTNRKLFQRAVHPFLSPSWYIPHVMGHLPYFKSLPNVVPRLLFRLPLELQHLLGLRSRNEHLLTPDWESLNNYAGLHNKWEQYKDLTGNYVSDIFKNVDIVENNNLPLITKLSLMQIAANISHFHNTHP